MADDAPAICGLLGAAFTASALPQWVFEPTTLRIHAVNDAAILFYGYMRPEFLAMTVLQLHPAEDQDRAHALCAGDPGGCDPHVWRHVTKRGDRQVRVAVSDLPAAAAPARLVQVFDVTPDVPGAGEHEHLAPPASDAGTRPEDPGQPRDTWLATVFHELRQPLTPMFPAITVMEQRVSREAGIRARELIKRQISVLSRLVDDLLDTARAQQAKVTLQRRTHDLRKLVEDVVASHFVEIADAGLILDTGMPLTPIWVSIDETRFHQILTNLLTNAIRHSDPGQRVTVRTDVTEDVARLVVADEGRGIDPAMLAHIFDPFAQAERGAHGGLGLGLSIVRTLVDLHGGQVSAASRGRACGAEFIVTLPISAPPSTVAGSFGSDLRSVAGLIRSRIGTGAAPLDRALADIENAVLLADDGSRLRYANDAALALTGYTSREAGDLRVDDLVAMDTGGVDRHWQRFIGDGMQEGILVLRCKDGRRVPVRYCAVKDVQPGLHLSVLAHL